MTSREIEHLLNPFQLRLTHQQVESLSVYLDLLMKWNRRINLTAVRTARECVTRHFGESLFVIGRGTVRSPLLDIGTGAGFPGLALKLAQPDLRITLLEPSSKKRAFLKEVVRTLEMDGVEVESMRWENFCAQARRTSTEGLKISTFCFAN